jgi:hypothetical protein
MVAEPRAGAVKSETAPLVALPAAGVEAIEDEGWGWRSGGRSIAGG